MATILIIDDVKTDRDLLGKVVTTSGHHPEYAVDGQDGIVKARALKPALILLDVMMPNLNGFETCRKLKADPETASIPVVLVTSKGGESDKFWGQKQGANDHVVKPFTTKSLTAVISRHVR
jgi:twitching motility two-component system response regulator PilH